jgi:hypothetical protein
MLRDNPPIPETNTRLLPTSKTARLTLSGIEFSDLTILRIERGERFVPDYEIAVIADYFKVSADYLLGRTEQ